MPKKITVRMDFRYYKDAQLGAFAQFVHDNMTGNAAFPVPDVPLADLQALITAYNHALEAARNGDAINATLLKQARTELKAALLKQARYVNYTAYNDELKIISSGYQHGSGQRLHAALPAVPTIRRFGTDHQKGTLSIQAGQVKGARSYTAIVEAVQEHHAMLNGRTIIPPAGIVAVCSSIQRKMRLTGLQSGVRYRVQVFAVGTAGTSAGSNTLEFIAQ